MFKQSDTIHFGCTQCGQCCQKSPHTIFTDIFDLSNEFIFQTAHHANVSYAKFPLEKTLIEHYQNIGHTIMMPELDASLFYFIDFMTVAYPSYKTCPKLKNNLCSIYNKRPISCQLAPLNSRYAENEQYRALNFYKNNTDHNQWKCDFSDSAPTLIRNEAIYSPHQNSLYNIEASSIREFTDDYIEFLGLASQEYQHNHFKMVFESVSKNALMITDMIIALQAARNKNIVSEDLACTFMENQIKLIEKEINVATDSKRKEDLPTTRLYKRQKDDYIRAIKDNAFGQRINDLFEVQ